MRAPYRKEWQRATTKVNQSSVHPTNVCWWCLLGWFQARKSSWVLNVTFKIRILKNDFIGCGGAQVKNNAVVYEKENVMRRHIRACSGTRFRKHFFQVATLKKDIFSSIYLPFIYGLCLFISMYSSSYFRSASYSYFRIRWTRDKYHARL